MRATPTQIQRFHVIGEIGSGGMGRVYRALDPQLDREVAIKVLNHPRAGSTPPLSIDDTIDLEQSSRPRGAVLLAEARMMARLCHPNVATVYEVGFADGALFVVMEHIEGCNLATWLRVPRALDDILHVLAQACRGLRAAHARGIVHRDFKPTNVLVGRDGRVRVADFGLSHLVNAVPSGLVRTDVTVGTPSYMAPELLRGEQARPAADVFAFATTMAEALGCPPGTTSCERERRLRDRGISSRLRCAIAAGLAEQPIARCSLDVVLASIEAVASTPAWFHDRMIQRR
jgi:serine/threonine protein kinase